MFKVWIVFSKITLKKQGTSKRFKLFPIKQQERKRTSTFVFIAVCRTTLAAFLILILINVNLSPALYSSSSRCFHIEVSRFKSRFKLKRHDLTFYSYPKWGDMTIRRAEHSRAVHVSYLKPEGALAQKLLTCIWTNSQGYRCSWAE